MHGAHRVRLTLAIALTLLTVGLAGCAAPESQQETIKIGTLLPLTGGLSTFGPDMERAVELAVEEINDAGGIDGRQIELVTEDSRTDPGQAPQAMQRLIQAGVVAVVGAASSGVTNSVLETAVSNDVVLITPASTSPALTAQDNDYLFYRVPPNDVMQGKVLARMLAEDNVTRVSTLYVNNAYGQGLNDALKQTFTVENQDGVVQAEVAFDDRSTTFDSEIQQASTGDPDAIVYIGYPGTGVPLMRQAHEQGVTDNIPFYFSEGVFSSSFVEDIGTTEGGDYILEGFKGSTPEALTGATATETFVAAFEEAYDHEPGLFAAQSYDAAAAVVLAIAAAGSDDADEFKTSMLEIWNTPGQKVSREDWGQALSMAEAGSNIDYRGVSSDFDWNDNGDPTRGLYAVWQVTAAGEIDLIQRDIEETLE